MDVRFYLAWICIVHLSIFAFMLLRKKTNKTANRVLAWFMLNFAFIHSNNIMILSRHIVNYHILYEFGVFTIFSQGPLYLWFVLLMTGMKINWKKYFYLHALPFVVGFAWAINCIFRTNAETQAYYDGTLIKQPLDMTLLTSLAALQMAFYLILSVRLLNRYNSTNKNKSGNEILELRWLRNLTVTFFIVVFILAPILIIISKDDVRIFGVMFPVMTMLIYAVIFYKSINFPGADEEKKMIMQYEREKISQDMHDDLGSGLSKISILSNNLKQQFKDDKTIIEQIDKIAKTSEDLVSNMNHMVWAVDPENDSLENLLYYIREYSIDFLESCNLKYQIDFPEKNSDAHFSQEHRKNIFLAIKETLNNIAKHANATTVLFTISMTETELQFMIKDDGKGFINNDQRTGNGLRNIKERMDKIGSRFALESIVGQGTTTHLSISMNKT